VIGSPRRFEATAVEEKGIVVTVRGDKAPAVKMGDVVIAVDSRYFRPAEVDNLLWSSVKAAQKLGWHPSTSARDMCAEMVAEDLATAWKQALLRAHGYEISAGQVD